MLSSDLEFVLGSVIRTCLPAVSELVEDADNALFERAMRDKHHVLYGNIFFLIVKLNLNTI